MNRKIWKLAAVAIAAVVLAGCANYGDYYASVDAANARQVDLERARAEAEAVRYQALVRIAESGDPAAKVAAVMALAGLGQGGHAVPRTNVPAQPQNEALQWASVLVPGASQLGTVWLNGRVSMNASDNATRLGIHTNDTFARFAAEIAKPPLVVTQPDPVIVPQPDPVIVVQPPPVIVPPGPSPEVVVVPTPVQPSE